MKDRAAFLSVSLFFGVAGCGQTPGTTTPLRFEVASVKPVPGGRGGGQRGPSPGGLRYLASNITLYSLITEAYQVRFDMVEGGPDWIRRDFFDVQAKAERPSSGAELRAMLQNLLADRFKLRLHRDTRQLPVYDLAVDKNGPKLTLSAATVAGVPSIDQPLEESHRVKMAAKSVPMKYLAWRLQGFVDRPIIDKTGLTGEFDFDLAFVEAVDPAVAERAAANGRQIDSHPTIFEAVRRQLGLRLESGRGPVEFVVIDHAEKPSGN